MEHEKFFFGMLLFLGVLLGAVFFSPLGNGNNLALLPSVVNQAPVSKPSVVSPQKGVLILKLTKDSALPAYLLLQKNQKNAKYLDIFGEYKGTNAPLWGKPLYRLTAGGRDVLPKGLSENLLYQDFISYFVIKFDPKADIGSILKEIKDDPKVVFAVESRFSQAVPSLVIPLSSTERALSESTTSSEPPSCDFECCENKCHASWEGLTRLCLHEFNAKTLRCETQSPPDPLCPYRAKDEYSDCLVEADNYRIRCRKQCKSSPPPPPPPSNPGGGTPRSGSSNLFYGEQGGECDPTQPLTNCESGGSLLP